MTDTESLLNAIEAMPDDDTLRGAYADELEKHKYSPRAEMGCIAG